MSTEFTDWDWVHSADAKPMLEQLFPMRGHNSAPLQPRKLKLYYAACARRAYCGLNAFQRGLLETVERHVEQPFDAGTWPVLCQLAEDAAHGYEVRPHDVRDLRDRIGSDGAGWDTGDPPGDVTERTELYYLIFQAFQDNVPAPQRVATRWHSADAVRCVFPNPFRAVRWAPSWRSEMAKSLAGEMYRANRFEAMPALADALEEAGCSDPEVLLHCRETHALHYRGCWVVDGVHFGLQ